MNEGHPHVIHDGTFLMTFEDLARLFMAARPDKISFSNAMDFVRGYYSETDRLVWKRHSYLTGGEPDDCED